MATFDVTSWPDPLDLGDPQLVRLGLWRVYEFLGRVLQHDRVHQYGPARGTHHVHCVHLGQRRELVVSLESRLSRRSDDPMLNLCSPLSQRPAPTSYVDQELSDLRVNSTTYRPDLETTAELGFSMSGSLSPRIAPGQFIQYRPLVANGTFALTLDDYLSPVKRWEGVASRYFGADVGAGGGGAGGARDTTGGGSNGARSGVIRSGGGVAMMTVFAVVCVGWVW